MTDIHVPMPIPEPIHQWELLFKDRSIVIYGGTTGVEAARAWFRDHPEEGQGKAIIATRRYREPRPPSVGIFEGVPGKILEPGDRGW